MTLEYDITDICFPLADLTEEDWHRIDLYKKAENEAAKIVGTLSPIKLLAKTEEIYKTYLERDGLKYDDERGM